MHSIEKAELIVCICFFDIFTWQSSFVSWYEFLWFQSSVLLVASFMLFSAILKASSSGADCVDYLPSCSCSIFQHVLYAHFRMNYIIKWQFCISHCAQKKELRKIIVICIFLDVKFYISASLLLLIENLQNLLLWYMSEKKNKVKIYIEEGWLKNFSYCMFFNSCNW